MLKRILSWLRNIFQYICALIYDVVITLPLTKYFRLISRAVYKNEVRLLNRRFEGEKYSMIDIGTGTGLPLLEFMKVSNAKRVLAVDIDQAYVKKAQARFKDSSVVEVKLLDFLKIDSEPKEKFDVVFFGFSIMVIPDKVEALQKASKLVSDKGVILVFLTLYDKKNAFFEFVKPKIKFLTSIDFGEAICVKDVASSLS